MSKFTKGNTRESAVEKVKEEYEKNLKRAELEDALFAKFDTLGVQPSRIHIHNSPLYGEEATVKFGDSYRASDEIEYCDLPGLVVMLPPVRLVLVKGTFTSIMPREYIDSLPGEKKDRWNSEVDISPLYLKLERENRSTLHWVSKIGGHVVEVCCAMSFWKTRNIATYDVKRVEFRGGHRYERPRVVPQVIDICGSDDQVVAQAQSPIIWAAGSDEYASESTVYWIDIGRYDAKDVGVWQAETFAKAVSKTK